MVPTQLKLGVSITTIELYADIPLFVTFDLYLGHRFSIIMCKIDSFSILGTVHVIKMKLGMGIKYINCMSHIPVLFGYFAFRGR